MKNYKDTIEKLERYGQNHIVKIMEKMTEEEKDRLSEQVKNLDLDSIEHLYNELTKKEVNVGKEIEPISALKKNKLSLEELEEMNNLGKNVIVSNQFAVATMSGGQGLDIASQRELLKLMLSLSLSIYLKLFAIL